MMHNPRLPLFVLLRLAGLVLIGSTVGTFVRAALEAAAPPRHGQWPWATFVINLVGSLVLGFLLEALARRGNDAGWRRLVRLGIGTGLIGGFTTYSTFILEIDTLIRAGEVWTGAAYTMGSLLGGIAAAGAGVFLAQELIRPARTVGGA